MSERRIQVVICGWDEDLEKEIPAVISKNALKMIDPAHYHVHRGEAFSHSGEHQVAAGARFHHLILTSSDDIHLTNHGISMTGGPGELVLYEAPFYDVNSLGAETGGTGIINHKRTDPSSSNVNLYLNAFIDPSSFGLLLDYAMQPTSTGGPARSGGSGEGADNEFILKPETAYLLTMINSDNSAVEVATKFTLYKNPEY